MLQIELFPAPSPIPHPLSPTRWPGITPESVQTLRELLKENYKKWHICFNEIKFHNHITHRLLALWALGAGSQVLKAAYEFDSKEGNQRFAVAPTKTITVDEFRHHFGDENYFGAYVNFFIDLLAVKNGNGAAVLEEFVFSSRADLRMRTRFFGGLLHSFIHVGYGLEFGIPGMVVQGLALAATHSDTPGFDILIHRSTSPGDVTGVDKLVSGVKDTLSLGAGPKNIRRTDTHALTILARVMKDPEMDCKFLDPQQLFSFFANDQKARALLRHVNQWSLDTSDPKELEKKIEELLWTNTLIFTAAGLLKAERKKVRADFYLMHLVTSSLFLPSLATNLSPSSQQALLRSYLTVSLAVYIARGRPVLDVGQVFDVSLSLDNINLNGYDDDSLATAPETPTLNDVATPQPQPAEPAEPGSQSKSKPESLTIGTASGRVKPNPWHTIIPHSLLHLDDHLPKFQRAVAHYASIYGHCPRGCFSGRGIELKGIDRLDGTLFVRAGILAYNRVGRERGGRMLLSYWDFKGFYGVKRRRKMIQS
ncbi:hypothetical protein D9757_008729 [Collybiopsis confluens]|uniref:Uncharacterized protein n=1 Tax=Collybiopsis confluens TaxID=2823264 RepID=A0A8H5H8H7_9AGAR|nr:hypothetical protein D9757_008729 [Collybiopsis confluens]